MSLPQRKRTRLEGYDYRADGYYFVTICIDRRKTLFSRIVGQGLAPAENALSSIGLIAEKQLLELEKRFIGVTVDKYVIMPNHIHAIIAIERGTAGASPCPTLSNMICSFKSLTVRECRKNGYTEKLFQTSFYDHIIRGERDYQEIWTYIDGNVMKWNEDRFYADE